MITRTLREQFVKGSDNVIALRLYEGTTQLSGAWSNVDIYIGNPLLVTISRAADGNGITFSNGLLQIRPSALIETLTALVVGAIHPVYIRVKDFTTHTAGAWFGEKDSYTKLFFEICAPPPAP